MELSEAIRTTRSMRRLKPDPIPDEAIRIMLEAAVRAASGGNRQTWSFIVIRNPEIKGKLGALYLECAREYLVPNYGPDASLSPAEQAGRARLLRSAMHLAEHFHEAPVLIAACLDLGQPADRLSPGTALTQGASIYPAVQNLMLTAREQGIGSTLTTLHRRRNAAVKEILKLPPEVEVFALIPLGYPEGRWGEGPRRALEEIVFRDTYGERLY